MFFGPAPDQKKRVPVCVCHPKHNQAGPTRVRARNKRFYVRNNFRTFTGAGWPDVHSDGKGREFKVGSIDRKHDRGMRYILLRLQTNKKTGEKQWDLLGAGNGSCTTRGACGSARAGRNQKLEHPKKAQQQASGEWKVL